MSHYIVNLPNRSVEVQLIKREGAHLVFTVAGETYEVSVAPTAWQRASSGVSPDHASPTPTINAPKAKSGGKPGEIRAPMPGIIVRIPVEKGQQVTRGQTVVVIEAMKMENNLTADKDGTVSDVSAKAGQEVDSGQVLLVIS